MPYRDHPFFQPPDDPDVRVWLYLDLPRFLSLVERQALFFVRADTVCEDDGFDKGLEPTARALETIPFRQLDPEVGALFRSKYDFDNFRKMLKDLRAYLFMMRRNFAVSCWHMGEADSADLWRHYLPSGDGVAVASTFRRLCRAVDRHGEDPVHVGVVRYLRYEDEHIPIGNLLYPVLHKRWVFRHEREVRAAVMRLPAPALTDHPGLDGPAGGLDVTCDPETLIEQVVVSPSTTADSADGVREALGHAGLDTDVRYAAAAGGLTSNE